VKVEILSFPMVYRNPTYRSDPSNSKLWLFNSGIL